MFATNVNKKSTLDHPYSWHSQKKGITQGNHKLFKEHLQHIKMSKKKANKQLKLNT